MDLMLTEMKKMEPPVLRPHIAGLDGSGGWPTYVITNHDIVRSYTRYGDGAHSDDIAKMMAGFYLTLRGTQVMYYGEEIGMENNDPKRKEDVKDPVGILSWPTDKGRDGERTPMQWTGGTNAGFTTGTPWLPVPSSAATHNVEAERKDSNSVFTFYKTLLHLRKNEPAFREGKYVPLNENDANVLSYLRQTNEETILVAINFSTATQSASFDLSKQGMAGAKAKALLQNGATAANGDLKTVELAPHGVYIAKVSK
jgi:alpha-glucosidase